MEYGILYLKLPMDKKHELVISQEGRESFVREFVLTERGPKIVYEIAELPMAFWGKSMLLLHPFFLLERLWSLRFAIRE